MGKILNYTLFHRIGSMESQIGGRWPFLVKVYDSIPGPRWIGISLVPALLESGLFVGGLSLAIVSWFFGLPIDSGLPSLLALSGSLLSLQFIWHLLHLSLSDVTNLRWKSAFENITGIFTAVTIVVIFFVLYYSALGNSSVGLTILGLISGLVLPHTVGNIVSEQRQFTLERRTEQLGRIDELTAQGEAGVEDLTTLTRDRDETIRVASLMALGKIGTDGAVNLLKARLMA